MTSETYPSGRTVTTNYDGTNRVSSVTGSFNGSTPTYANNLVYSPHGAATQVAYGNNLWRSSSYNSLLQMSDFVDALNNSGGNEFLNVSLSWYANGNLSTATFNHGGAAANNGGISYTNFLTFNQTYSYDNVNRLIGVSDTGTTCTGAPLPPSSTPVCYSRGFGYDAYGNMWVTSPTGIVPAGNTPQSNVYNGSNRITSGTYNAAGNETIVNGNTITYDAEGRQTSVVGAGVNETYAYGGDGNRVEKAVGGSPQTVFVYDALGRMAAEYSAGAETPACITCYLSPDHLGTPRMVTDQNANVVARHDYLPFGEEVPANVAGRNSQWGTGNDTINQKFTGKERDSESGLDYFGARYYGSALGRFTSPDPLLNSGRPDDPQSWNRYSYTLNNPLRYTDPLGLYVWGNCAGDADKCQKEEQRFRDSIAKAKDALAGLDPKSKDAKALQATLDKLGDEGKGNVKINFGDAGKTDGQPNLGKTVGNSITINYDAVDSVKSGWSLNASESAALDAGVTTHEGTHAGGGPSVLGFIGMRGEHSAYFTESVTYEGLHNTDRPFGLWNESWLNVDRPQLEQKREQAIQGILHPQKAQDQKQGSQQ